MRLRLAWGSGTAAKQRWTGTISIAGGVLSELQPLGVETDAPVAQRIEGDRLVVAPLEKRGFDGCDVTVRAEEQAVVRIVLQGEQTPQPTVLEATFNEILSNQLRKPLDELGSFFLAHRSPGDVLRVLPTREHYVFSPQEKWELQLQPDLAAALQAGPIVLDLQLRPTGKAKSIWQTRQLITTAAQLDGGISFPIECPAAEGAYRITLSARHEEGFAGRFVPGQQSKAIATREIEFVVIDPAAKLPMLVDEWLPVLTIDPANPSWWQRLPAWAQVPRLRGRIPGAVVTGVVGNVRPVVRPAPTGDLIELPPAPATGDPYWQAFTLPVREPGVPHLVEIEYPVEAEQHLAISVVEPNADGRVTRTHGDAGLYSDGGTASSDGKVAVHRFLFWPSTRSPQLLIVNRHPTAPGQFGKINLLKQEATQASLADTEQSSASERLVAGYLSKPNWIEHFGAVEILDPESGLSVHSWSTFLDGTQRLVQSLRRAGYNSLMISVAADGSAWYPSRVLNPSPRYDTGLLATNGQDPLRKDVLEMLLRVFDREGIRVIPTVQLASPLPGLEALRTRSNQQATGIGCIGYEGQEWLALHPTNSGLAPYYNPLNERVQMELESLIAELTNRYRQHPSLAGVGVQLSGEGYGMLPGPAWGLDDQTVAEFSRTTGVVLPGEGDDRFHARANLCLSQHRQAWLQWRTDRITQLYEKLASRAAAERGDLRLILATEDLFAGSESKQRLRQSLAQPTELSVILAEHGIDLARLNTHPQIVALSAHRLNSANQLQEQALDLRINAAADQHELLNIQQSEAELFHHATSQFLLPSFDQRSPFGAEHTFLTITSQPLPVGINARRHWATSMASDDAQLVVESGPHFDLKIKSTANDFLEVVRQLPNADMESRSQRAQPVAMHVYRTGEGVVLAMINEAPWPVGAEVPLVATQAGEWWNLAVEAEQRTGNITAGQQQWRVELEPYEIQAWRFSDSKLRVGELRVFLGDLAKQDLENRIQAIESRAGNLNIERPFAQLQNPGFEFEEENQHIVGWQPRMGQFGNISLVDTNPRTGVRALKLRSEDALGVAVQSHLFPAPETGQLLVSAFLRVEQMDAESRLEIAVRDVGEGRNYGPFAVLTSEQLSGNEWSHYEFALGDVPCGNDEQLRLVFHLAGNAEVFVDDVQLYDLRFDEARRRSLVKRIYAARVALEQEQVVDCLRVVDDYWSKYLVEYVPPVEAPVFQEAKQPRDVQATEKNPSGIGSRLRGWVPKMWR